MIFLSVVTSLALFSASCEPSAKEPINKNSIMTDETIPVGKKLDTATFGTGCFWCTEAVFQELKGVVKATSGYTGGHVANPSYEEVCTGTTGHAESLQVIYDPAVITFDELLEVFWEAHDPTSLNRQGNDVGTQYRSAIFWLDEAQKKTAEESKRAVEAQLKKKVVTEIVAATQFWDAEDYHQDFYKKNPGRYYSYRAGCGRDARLREVWGDKAGHSAVH